MHCPKDRRGHSTCLFADQGRMKRRRLLLSVDLLPTISETIEDASQVWCAGNPSQSMEDYVDSIKELAQPASLVACGPLRVQRLQRSRLASFPLVKRSTAAILPCSPASPFSPCLPVTLDSITLTFSTKRDCSASFSASRDPLDWLFAQTQCGDSSIARTKSAALCLL
ncbi:hypothetical protein JZ751_007727 [Albula glossodonta]|uniref:Uncharacterized protein n=1 Tax=Albula glossodonta TaxID=121402 RepID=A0A8T2NXX2_9TELE|nr:hypothetical protein JZ751_007727 [Albula glossodonta]